MSNDLAMIGEVTGLFCAPGLPISKRQTAAEHLDRIERESGIEAAFDIGGLPETVLLSREPEIADGVSVAPQRLVG